MKTSLLLLLVLSTSAAAALNFSMQTQIVYPGQDANITLGLQNDIPIWGFTLKIQENPSSPIDFFNATQTARLSGGLNGATRNTQDKITLYSVFAGNTQGILPGEEGLFTLTYKIPNNTPYGQYQLEPTGLSVSDNNGQTIEASITGASIVVVEEPPTELRLPEVSGRINSPMEVPICLSNTEENQVVKTASMIITHNSTMAKATSVKINNGTGTYEIKETEVEINISMLNVKNADCEQNTGANVAIITYIPLSVGSSPLIFQTASTTYEFAESFTTQAVQTKNGMITGQNTAKTQSSSGKATTGGGAGAPKNCAQCGNYTCCGVNNEQAGYFCKNPETYSSQCNLPEETQSRPELPVWTQLKQPEKTEQQAIVHEAAQAEIQEEQKTPEKAKSKLPWAIGLAILTGIIFLAARKINSQ